MLADAAAARRSLRISGLLIATAWICVSCVQHDAARRSGAAPVGSRPPPAAGASIELPAVLVENGIARATIVAEPDVLAATGPQRGERSPQQKERAALRLRLRASIDDLRLYVQKMSGADVPVTAGEASSDGGLVILIGRPAEERFGPMPVTAPGAQGYRLVVTPSAIGVYGESDLGASYAIYELLDRLGCRWFMPGGLGEVVPIRKTIELSALDLARGPSTIFRDLWYVDEPFRRRNRLGGVRLNAGHMLERWVTKKQRDEHPEWRAIIQGQPSETRLRWNRPEVAQAIAAAVADHVEQRAVPSVSLSPLDGDAFDESEDRALDAGDRDPTTGGISLTDRLMVLANRVAKQLSPRYPDLWLGVYAYASYTRPPVRETVPASVVPVMAPITYCRAHPLTDDRCPGARELREAVRGWASKARLFAYRPYLYNLAETSAPNPMIRKWSAELPWVLAQGAKFWQPETLSNFETSLPALWLAVRLPWDRDQDPARVLDDLYSRFYGSAAREVRAYYDVIDRAWAETPEFSGNNLGYARRFTPAWLAEAERALGAARAACQTDLERARIALLDESLQLFRLYLGMMWDLRAGRVAMLERDAERWLTRAKELAERHHDSSSFGAGSSKHGETLHTEYFQRFMLPIYRQATGIGRDGVLLAPEPVCRWRYAAESEANARQRSSRPKTADGSWKTTDACTETWSSLGLQEHFGSVWYSTSIDLTANPPPKKSFAWIARADGVVRLFVDGVPAPAVTDTRATAVEAALQPVTFDVTRVLKSRAVHQIDIVVQRTRLREVGGGGLLGPVIFYRTRAGG